MFQPAGDFVDASGSQALVPDDLLLPSSATLLALFHDNPSPAKTDSLLLSDLDCRDGKLASVESIPSLIIGNYNSCCPTQFFPQPMMLVKES